MGEFLQSNWLWILLIIGFVGMHSFGGGCCGIGRQRRRDSGPENGSKEEAGKSCH
jgi:hypothetical protein